MSETATNLLYVGFFVYFCAICLVIGRMKRKPEIEEAPQRRILAAQFIPEGGEPRPMVYFDEEPSLGQAIARATQPTRQIPNHDATDSIVMDVSASVSKLTSK